MDFLRQFCILSKKNLKLRKAHYILTIVEFVLPILVSISMIFISSLDPNKGSYYSPAYHAPEPMAKYKVFDNNLFYYPPNSFTETLTKMILSKGSPKLNITAFKSEELLIRAIKNNSVSTIGLIFHDANEHKLSYSICKNTYSGSLLLFTEYPDYYVKESIQVVLNNVYMKYMTSHSNLTDEGNKIKMFLEYFPRIGYSLKAFNGIAPFTNSIIIVSTLTIFVSVYVYRIVQEKRSGLRELLRLNGMKISVNYLSWCFHGFIALFILSLSWIAFMSISTDQSAFLEGTNKFIVWIVLLLYSISLLLFSTFISVFFSNGIYAVIFTILIMQGTLYGPIFSTGLLNDMNEFRFMSVDFRLSLCLLPNSTLFLVLKLILALKMNDSDLTWNTMNDSANTYDNFTMSSIILMQFVACIFYSILIWYFDAVWPWQIGVSKPPYFFLLKSYWTNKIERDLPQELLMDSDENSQFHESIPSSQRVGIWVKNLTKKFGNKAAASDVNLKIFEGQITALLGHNGAGKTTTLSVIAGMYKPTHGSVYIDGINLVNDIDLIRKKMGYCPQTNIHFNELTVYDHLELTATLKAYPKHKIESEIEKIAATVGLFEKLNTPVSALSGGMKRKLSLGIALVGQTKVLLLDEPTSGLDPEARRELWDILQSIRHNKTILLTTHYMEEADILGDRIAIMTHGKVFCSGSPLYLKSKFGAGYHLRMILKDGFNVENILNFINQKVSAKFERLSGKELSLLISSCDYTELPNMLKEFENSTEDLFVENFGLSHTNMEDVFIKVGEMTSENGSKDNVNNSNNDLSSLNNTNNYEDALKETNKLTGYRLIINQIFALLCKRFHFNRRQIWGMIMQIALPLIFSVLMLYTPKWLSEARRARDANIDLHLNSLYKQTKTLVTVESDQIYSDYKNVLKGEKTEFIRTNNLKNEILKIQKESFAKFIYRYVIGSEINKTTNGYHITAFASSFAAYGMPISINKMFNLKFKLLNLPSRIESSFKPLMEEHNISIYDKFTRIAVFDPIMIAIFLPLALGFISSTATLFLIEEKNSKSKHLQLMTNLHPALFWFCHFLWDIIICLIISFACGLIVIYSSVIKDDSSASGAVILLFLFYNLSYIPFVYIISLWLKKPAYGFAIILGLTTAIGTAGQVLAMINFFSKKRLSIHLDSMVKFIKIFPPASLSISISELNYQQKLKPLCPFIQYLDCTTLRKKPQEYACCIIPKDYNPFGTKYGESGASLLYMMGFGMVFWAIFIILESKLFQKFLVLLKNNFKKRKEDNHSLASIDADVIAEEDLVTDVMQRHNSSLAIYKLRKEFKEIVAVDSFSILVPEKKCFGLLGVNGAGKTTTFSMIVADQFKTSGDARIHNYHLSSTISNFQKMIGYCPQSNALLHLLSGSEMIYLFARLRGIPEAKIKRMVDVLVKLVDLEEHINKQCEIYSGGNKRKLNIALAVIGLPPLLLLDEPTSGIDPVSRRQIWKLLTNVKEMGLSLLLSSHSMEECEALCDKLTIMTKGSLKCIGSITHLKNKFRNGFTILAKLKLENEDNNDAKINNLTARIQRDINNISLKKQNIGLLTYHIENPQESWSHMFQVMEKIKEETNLEDYVITSTTLEEVFMSFVSSDNDDS